MESGSIGKNYQDGEVIFRQGEEGNCMYVIQAGKVEIIREVDGTSTRLAVRGEGDFFGEMSLFEKGPRMATARAAGSARVLTVDKRTLLRKFQEDPSLALRIVETMSRRIRELSEWVISGKAGV